VSAIAGGVSTMASGVAAGVLYSLRQCSDQCYDLVAGNHSDFSPFTTFPLHIGQTDPTGESTDISSGFNLMQTDPTVLWTSQTDLDPTRLDI
jgi:hypothetical protein